MADSTANKPNRAKVRSLAGEAKRPVEEAIIQLQLAGFTVKHGNDGLAGAELRRAREALGLRAWGAEPVAVERLGRDDLLVRMLRPMAAMGKHGPEHHTNIVHLYAKGIPDDQKGEARALVEDLLRDGALGEKQNVGQRHVWLTNKGRALLDSALLRLGKDLM
jgi:hypothetical protein